MLTILFCICMYRIAEVEKRRGWLWACVTLALSATFQVTLLPGYWGAVAGLVLAYGTMTLVIMKRPIKKGPFIQ